MSGVGVPRYLAHLIVFFTGTAVLIVEILGPRLLAPLFGTSVNVWSAVISITLVALSIGYWLGGYLADTFNGSLRVLIVLLIAAGFLVGILPLVSPTLLRFSVETSGIEGGVLLAAMLLFMPPLLLLGTACPFVAGTLVKTSGACGKTIGGIYAISTLGSIVGALGSAHLLVPYLGLFGSFQVAAAITILPALPLISTANLRISLALVACICGLSAHGSPAAARWQDGPVHTHINTNYGDVKVLDNISKGQRILLVDGAYQNIVKLSDFDDTPAWYVRTIDAMAVSLLDEQSEIAVIGMGSGILPKLIRPFVKQVSVVEINPYLVPIAEQFFGFESSDFRIFIEDGRQYFQRQPESSFDAVVLDVFNGTSIPYHLFSFEAFKEVRRSLRDRGILFINILGFTKGPNSKLFDSVFEMLSQTYKSVAAFSNHPDDYPDSRSILLVASPTSIDLQRLQSYVGREPLHQVVPAQKGNIITDDLNPTDLWTTAINSRWKEKTLEQLGVSVLVQ